MVLIQVHQVHIFTHLLLWLVATLLFSSCRVMPYLLSPVVFVFANVSGLFCSDYLFQSLKHTRSHMHSLHFHFTQSWSGERSLADYLPFLWNNPSFIARPSWICKVRKCSLLPVMFIDPGFTFGILLSLPKEDI